MQPTLQSVHVNRPLTNISVAFVQSQANFVATQVFPMVPVQKQSDRYFQYLREDFFRSEMRERAPATESAGSGYRLDNTPTYYAPVYAVHKDIDDQIRANADIPLDMDRDATIFITQQGLIHRENVWVRNFFIPGAWDTNLTGVPGSPGAGEFLEWGQPDSTPIEDITSAGIDIAEATGFRPNTLVFSPRVFNAIKNHPDVLDRIKYTQRGIVTAEILAGLFEVDRVLVPWATQNEAAEGIPGDFSFIYGKHALLVYSAPSPGIMVPTGGYTFVWTGFMGAAQMGQRIKRFRMEHLSADRIELDMAFDMKLVSSALGVFFEDAVA